MITIVALLAAFNFRVVASWIEMIFQSIVASIGDNAEVRIHFLAKTSSMMLAPLPLPNTMVERISSAFIYFFGPYKYGFVFMLIFMYLILRMTERIALACIILGLRTVIKSCIQLLYGSIVFFILVSRKCLGYVFKHIV